MKWSFWLVALLCLAAADGALAGESRLDAVGADWSFGQIFAGERVEHVFLFKNGGDAPLLIDRVRSSCGCTAALLSEQQILPGESGEIRTSFDSSRFNGPVTKTIYLYTNDPVHPVSQFFLRGTVRPEITLDPARVDLGALQPGVAQEVRITLTNQGSAEVSFSRPEVTIPELEVSLEASRLAAGAATAMVIRGTARDGQQRLNGYVLLATAGAHLPELRIPVSGMVTKVAAQP